jgi:molecular chaperone DnaK (HSP70)
MMKGRIAFGVLSLFLLHSVTSELIGIDFGTEWLKVGIVGQKAFDVVLNDNSARKTPTVVSFDRGEYLVGVDALNVVGT